MRLLLDTHAILWWLSDDPRLSTTARAAIADLANELTVSAAAAYEMVYKQRLGKLQPLPEPLATRLRREGIAVLPITIEHAVAAARLRGPHRDPWDRIMVAQATIEGLTVVTIDQVFDDYRIAVLW